MSAERDRLADRFADLAAEAGRAILDVRARGAAARLKADSSPVTAADEAAEAILREGLARLLPGVPLVAEEAVACGALPVFDGGPFLLVDPLDGTREFLAGSGEFTVNVALIEAGRPAAGVVYVPTTGLAYLGGESARRGPLAAGGRFDPAAAQPIRARPPGPEGLVAAVSRSHGCAATQAWLAAHRVAQVLTAGSALKFGLLAAGEADVYPRFTPTCEWDVAAGHAVLRAAGGDVTTPDGAPMVYGRRAAAFVTGPFVAWGRRPG